MTLELSQDELNRIVEALDHVAAYQRSQNHEDRQYLELADRLHRIKKPPVSVTIMKRVKASGS
jgi:hypothetical protein